LKDNLISLHISGLIMIKVNWACCKRIMQQRLAVLEHFQGSLKREEKSENTWILWKWCLRIRFLVC